MKVVLRCTTVESGVPLVLVEGVMMHLRIVCKQLGYGLAAGVTSTYTGSSSGSVSVYCNGHETSLAECSISSSSYSCYSQAVVSVYQFK